jgi:hypothetical protein
VRNSWGVGGLAAGAVIAAILAAACGGTSVADLEVGDCIRDAIPRGEVSTVHLVDCSEEHYAQVLAVIEVEDSEFPGLDELNTVAQQRCPEGTIDTMTPTEQSWNEAGDREVICLGE